MSRIVVLGPSEHLSIFNVIFDLSGEARLTDSNPSAIRNQLSYWRLAFEVMPQFQRLPEIQHHAAGIAGRLGEDRSRGSEKLSTLVKVRQESKPSAYTRLAHLCDTCDLEERVSCELIDTASKPCNPSSLSFNLSVVMSRTMPPLRSSQSVHSNDLTCASPTYRA
jgi:hypothetical protein